MDKVSFKKKIIVLSLLLLSFEINVRPYNKNFFLNSDIDETILDRISKISRSFITFEFKEEWISDNLVSMLRSRPQIEYNIIISGSLDNYRIKNIKQIYPRKIGYIVDEFITEKRIEGLNKLKPYNVFLIFKRVPEIYELSLLKEGKIKEITIILDELSAKEFVSKITLFEGFRVTLRIIQIEALSILCDMAFSESIVSIIVDERIGYVNNNENILNGYNLCLEKLIYEVSSATFYDNFMRFIKSGIRSVNIYYSPSMPKRDNIFDWIKKTDP